MAIKGGKMPVIRSIKNNLPGCIGGGYHHFAPTGYTYNKDDNRSKYYMVIYCMGCARTVELLVIDRGSSQGLEDRPTQVPSEIQEFPA